jgi:hypothetical protein
MVTGPAILAVMELAHAICGRASLTTEALKAVDQFIDRHASEFRCECHDCGVRNSRAQDV